jgi:hypothetical protein
MGSIDRFHRARWPVAAFDRPAAPPAPSPREVGQRKVTGITSAMNTHLFFRLASTRGGRVALHLACILAGSDPRAHWQGIQRELRTNRVSGLPANIARAAISRADH